MLSASFQDGSTCCPPDVDGSARWALYGLVGIVTAAIYLWLTTRARIYAYLVVPMLWAAAGAFGLYWQDGMSGPQLFTVLDREARFKAKPVIDVVVYRGGDVLTAWMFTLLAERAGLGLSGIAVVIGVIAVAWGATAIWLGRRYQAIALPSQHSRDGAGS